jgi:hypothetical protein
MLKGTPHPPRKMCIFLFNESSLRATCLGDVEIHE